MLAKTGLFGNFFEMAAAQVVPKGHAATVGCVVQIVGQHVNGLEG